MIKKHKIPNQAVSEFAIGFDVFGFVSVRGASFDIRILF